MPAYFYPTKPGWFEKSFDDWNASRRSKLSFAFVDFNPHTLPKNQTQTFWMYLYYAQLQTGDSGLKGIVRYRAHVIQRNSVGFEQDADVYVIDMPNPKVWFLCDAVEEVCDQNGKLLMGASFRHVDSNKNLFKTIRNSIAPVIPPSPLTVLKTIPNI